MKKIFSNLPATDFLLLFANSNKTVFNMKKSLLSCTAALLALSATGVALHQRHGATPRPVAQTAIDSEPEKVSVESIRYALEAQQTDAVGGETDAPRKAVSVTIDVPFEMTPTQQEVDMFTIIDTNDDSKKWKYVSNFKGLQSPSNSKMDCDDWAITPGIRFNSGDKNYELSFTMTHNMRGEAFQSSFEVYLGTSPDVDGMTTKIGEIANFYVTKASEDIPQTIAFGLPDGAAGVYYIGFRCLTKKDSKDPEVNSWGCTFKKIAVAEKESSAAAPAQPTDATVTPATEGGLSATVSFTMPTVAMNGQELAADKELTAILTSPAQTVPAKGLPGSPQSITVSTLQGDNALTLQVNGELDGEPLSLQTYTGVVLPKRVHDLTGVLSRDNMTYTLTWTAPTEGENGGYIDPETVEYDIYIKDSSTGEYIFKETTGTAKEYVYTLPEGSPLRTTSLQVRPRNAAGTSTDLINWINQDPVYVSDMHGTPHSLPAVETFDNLDMKYTPLTIARPDDNYAGRWIISDPSSILEDDNQSALTAYNPYNEDPTMGRVLLSKFSTAGINNAAFEMKYLRYSSHASTMTVYVSNYDIQLYKLGTLDCGTTTDWATVSYPLPQEFQDNPWIQIVVDVALDDVDYVYAIDSYSIKTSAEKDLALTALTSDNDVRVGEEASFTAEVTNTGFAALTSDVKFDVTCEGEVIASGTVAGNQLASGEKKAYTWSFIPTIADATKKIDVKASLVAADEVESNNSKIISTEVRKPLLPTVTTLSASMLDNSVSLTWQEPELNKTLTESFEDLEAFSYDEALGSFSNIDRDGKSVYKFSSNPMPNENLPKAFMVINSDELVYSEGLEAQTGKQYLMATCPERASESAPTPDPADDWLITPELCGGSYVSFYFGIINAAYPETIRLMYSTSDNNPDSFVEINKLTKQTVGWEKIECKLPADAKYFAINYVSRDMFGILIDDVCYVSANDLHTIAKYNVYRDGQFLGESTATEYVDDAVEDGQTYNYHVTTLTDSESSASPVATITVAKSGIGTVAAAGAVSISTTDGNILISNAGNRAVDIFSVDGKTICRGTGDGTYPVASGAYIVTVGDTTVKVLVR